MVCGGACVRCGGVKWWWWCGGVGGGGSVVCVNVVVVVCVCVCCLCVLCGAVAGMAMRVAISHPEGGHLSP